MQVRLYKAFSIVTGIAEISINFCCKKLYWQNGKITFLPCWQTWWHWPNNILLSKQIILMYHNEAIIFLPLVDAWQKNFFEIVLLCYLFDTEKVDVYISIILCFSSPLCHLSSTMWNTTGLISMLMTRPLPPLSTNVPIRLQTVMVTRYVGYLISCLVEPRRSYC